MVDRRRIVPAFAERVRDVTDRRPPQLQLEVVPGRSFAVAHVEFDGLHVSLVTGIVMTTVGQVDTADERHVVIGSLGAAYKDELLMMAPATPHALVEQDLTTRVIDLAHEPGVLLLTEVRLARMRAP